MTILEKAAQAVEAREKEYGHTCTNFKVISSLWTAYLGVRLTSKDVGAMMILLKIGRSRTGTITADTLVDIAGYARCLEMLDTED